MNDAIRERSQSRGCKVPEYRERSQGKGVIINAGTRFVVKARAETANLKGVCMKSTRVSWAKLKPMSRNLEFQVQNPRWSKGGGVWRGGCVGSCREIFGIENCMDLSSKRADKNINTVTVHVPEDKFTWVSEWVSEKGLTSHQHKIGYIETR